MTEYEVVDAITSLRSEAGGHVMNFVSVMFGFIVAAYLVGPKLSGFQVSAVTLVYLIWAPGPILAAYDSAVGIQNIYFAHQDMMTFELVRSPLISIVPEVVAISCLLSLIVSIVFLFQTRRYSAPDKPNAEPGVQPDA